VNVCVVRDSRPLDAPFPPKARGVDLVVVRYAYADLPSLGVDRRLLLANALDALRPGGRLVVLDRAAKQTSEHVETSRNARYEIERAGFHFVSEGRFLRSSSRVDDWDATPAAAPHGGGDLDRFYLTFRK
jgi:predicted methyltransferase